MLDNRKAFVLEEFEETILGDYFAGSIESLVLLPKGNGKTTLFAALALYHLIYTVEARCYIAASSREQATLMYDHARGFVERRNDDGTLTASARALQKRVVVKKGTREIRSLADSGFIKVLASDVDHIDGNGATLFLIDELHRHKKPDLYGIAMDGLGKRAGQMITISTAGATENSPLGKIRKEALALPGLQRTGSYTFARSHDGSFVLHEWSLTPDDDLEDLETVKTCNPASFVTIDWLRKRRDSPSMTQWRWARFACNVWWGDADSAISPIEFARCAKPGQDIPANTQVTLGLDLGWKWDTTALVPFAVDGEREMLGIPTIIEPPRDGTSTNPQAIKDALTAAVRRWNVQALVFDRNADGELIAAWAEEELGVTVVQHSQDPAPMADASMGIAAAIRSGALEHPDDEALNAHFLAAAAKTTTGEKWRFVKPRGGLPIDCLIAAAMARRVAVAPQTQSVYETRGLMIL